MRAYALAIGLGLLGVGVGAAVSRAGMEDPFTGEFERSPLHTLVLTSSRSMPDLVRPLQQWADGNGYKFRATSPGGQPGSVLLQMWNGTVVVIAGNRLGNGGTRLPGLSVNFYWNGDVADEAVLNSVVQQVREALLPLGAIETTSAPPGTSPRTQSSNRWQR